MTGVGGQKPIPYIRSHTALRGIAALLVVAYHLQFGDFYRLPIEHDVKAFGRSYLFVDLFFVLSGFVISLVTFADRDGRLTPQDTRRFYIARFARIYPLHLFCLIYVVVAGQAMGAAFALLHKAPIPPFDHLGSLVAELFLVQSWIPGAPHWNIPSWSISAEMVAYLLFPFVVNARSMSVTAVSVALVALPTGFYGYIAATSGSLDIVAGLAPLRCLSGFALGMLVYYNRGKMRHLSPAILAFGQIVSVGGLALVLSMSINDVVVIPFMVGIVATTWEDRGPLSRLLSHRLFGRLGDLSYSIYLNHVCIIGLLTPIWFKIATMLGDRPATLRLCQIVVFYAVIVIVSRWTYSRIEGPGRRFLLSRLSPAASTWRSSAPAGP